MTTVPVLTPGDKEGSPRLRIVIEHVIAEDNAIVTICRNWTSHTSPLWKDTLFTTCEALPTVQSEIVRFHTMRPRKEYACGDDGIAEHRYAGSVVPVHAWPAEIRNVRDALHTQFKIYANAALINEYRDEHDSIGVHSDREALGPDNIVFTISLGATRRFILRHKTEVGRKIVVQLHAGDLVIMRGKTQELWTHEVPKEGHSCSKRYSITMRFLNSAGGTPDRN